MRTRGFSLVELMISLALFGLIASGSLALVMSGARSQAHSARVDVAQSGLRAGLDYITRDLLSASAGARTGTIVTGTSGALVLPIVVTNSAAGADALEIYSIDASASATVMVNAPTTGTITVDATAPFTVGDKLMLSDLAAGTLLSLTGKSATTLTVSSPDTFPAGVTYPAGSFVFKSRHVKYAVDLAKFGAATTSGNPAALTLDIFDGNGPQPLAEGVEDLQVALGFDNNADGVVTEVGAAANDDEWTYNYAGDSAPVSLTNLKAVRITLITKSTAAEKGTFPARPKAEDRPIGAADGFFRRVIRSEVAIRNFNL